MVTIKQVAKEAGVSVATVSRVINNLSNVNPDKAKKVIEVIERLNYRPNAVARALYKRKTWTIGLLVPSIINPFFTQITSEVENIAAENDYKMILCNTHNDPKKEQAYINSLLLRQSDGFIVISDSNILEKVVDRIDKPVVALDRHISYDEQKVLKYPIVTTDNYNGGRMAACHLLDCGCVNLAHLGACKGSTMADLRAKGFSDFLEEKGIKHHTIQCPFTYNDGLNAAHTLFEKYSEVDGVFAGNDLIAFAIITVAFERGIDIPGQLQIIGFDNIWFSSLVSPALTTVSQSISLMGKTAAKLLINSINGIEVPNKVHKLPLKLTIRGTTKGLIGLSQTNMQSHEQQ